MTIKEYFATGHYTKTEAQTIGQELEQLARQRKSTAHDIVNAATPKDHPLHPYFEWDDKTAAQEHRMAQARLMARTITVRITNTTTGEQHDQRAFYAITTQPTKTNPFDRGQKMYLTLDQVAAKPDYRTQVIAEAQRQLTAWRQRYADLEEIFAPVFAAVDELTAEPVAA